MWLQYVEEGQRANTSIKKKKKDVKKKTITYKSETDSNVV